jgi:hypothetical protein
MDRYFMIDVSNPTAAGIRSMPDGYVAAAGYIGGNTPHVWTPAEWEYFAGWRKLPIWTGLGRGTTVVSGEQDGWQAVEALRAAGVPARAAEQGTPIALDLETAEVPGYVQGFASVAEWAGFPVYPYGSASTLRSNPECWGYWAADWTGAEHLLPWSTATQYQPASVHPYDLSELSEACFRQLTWI